MATMLASRAAVTPRTSAAPARVAAAASRGLALSPRSRPARLARPAAPRAALSDAGPGPSGGSGQQEEIFQGRYGPFQLDDVDRSEVQLYRYGLTAAAAAVVAGTLASYLPGEAAPGVAGPAYVVGAAGLGVSLKYIHMYMAPIKNTMLALYALGCAGSLALAVGFPGGAAVPVFVAEHNWAVWAVGPLFASFVGLAFKEGMCYGKLESAALFFLWPTLLLGHLAGVLSEPAERGLLTVIAGLLVLFASRKYSQPVQADVGDKSVFAHIAAEDAADEARRRAGGA